MALTAFTARLGVGQGRLTDATPSVFVLGDLDPGHLAELAPGDFAQVTQTADLTGVSLVRANVELRVPKSAPKGFSWVASILIDGTPLGSSSARSGRSRVITDMAANVSKLTGTHDVALRLALVATQTRTMTAIELIPRLRTANVDLLTVSASTP